DDPIGADPAHAIRLAKDDRPIGEEGYTSAVWRIIGDAAPSIEERLERRSVVSPSAWARAETPDLPGDGPDDAVGSDATDAALVDDVNASIRAGRVAHDREEMGGSGGPAVAVGSGHG